jgi:broad specificity phosphatase PhoE
VLSAQTELAGAGPIVLVAHDVVNRLLLAWLSPALGDWHTIPQRTACWNLLTRADGEWRVERVDQKSEPADIGSAQSNGD